MTRLASGTYYGRQPVRRSVRGIFLSESHHTENHFVPKHSHANAHLYFVVEGYSKEFISAKSRLCEPGTMVYHPPEEMHSNQWQTNGHCFCVEFFSNRFQQLQEVLDTIDPQYTLLQGHELVLIKKLYRELHSHDTASNLAVEGITLELVAELSRCAAGSQFNDMPGWLLDAKEAIHDQFLENLTLLDLALQAQVHPSHFAKVFRQYFNTSPGAYIRKLRIEWACQQLSTTSASIGEIALKAGFYDQSHFNRTFKKQTSMTPGQYQRLRN